MHACRSTLEDPTNAFAILGLRALYFLLAGMLDKFRHLSKGLAIILAFIGVKLILQAAHKTISTAVPEIPSLVSLAVVVVVLAGSVVLSLRHPPETPPEPLESPDAAEPSQGGSVEETVGRSPHHHG